LPGDSLPDDPEVRRLAASAEGAFAIRLLPAHGAWKEQGPEARVPPKRPALRWSGKRDLNLTAGEH